MSEAAARRSQQQGQRVLDKLFVVHARLTRAKAELDAVRGLVSALVKTTPAKAPADLRAPGSMESRFLATLEGLDKDCTLVAGDIETGLADLAKRF